jgi:hypothetical protein
MNRQQSANLALSQWQALRSAGLTPQQRIEQLFADFFAPIPPSDIEYQATLNRIAEEMA